MPPTPAPTRAASWEGSPGSSCADASRRRGPVRSPTGMQSLWQQILLKRRISLVQYRLVYMANPRDAAKLEAKEVDPSVESHPATALVHEPARLGAEDLGDSHHVCALFEGL